MDDLPTVYLYDHCPFCVRVRLALGIKNIKHKLYFMANDDVQTPVSLVGKKIAPIFVSLPYLCLALPVPGASRLTHSPLSANATGIPWR